MTKDNIVDLLIAVSFSMNPKLGGLGPKYQDVVISFRLDEGKTLTQFHFRTLQIRSEF